jgi:hypothetical protein
MPISAGIEPAKPPNRNRTMDKKSPTPDAASDPIAKPLVACFGGP